jgi:hypothetical protein
MLQTQPRVKFSVEYGCGYDARQDRYPKNFLSLQLQGFYSFRDLNDRNFCGLDTCEGRLFQSQPKRPTSRWINTAEHLNSSCLPISVKGTAQRDTRACVGAPWQ